MFCVCSIPCSIWNTHMYHHHFILWLLEFTNRDSNMIWKMWTGEAHGETYLNITQCIKRNETHIWDVLPASGYTPPTHLTVPFLWGRWTPAFCGKPSKHQLVASGDFASLHFLNLWNIQHGCPLPPWDWILEASRFASQLSGLHFSISIIPMTPWVLDLESLFISVYHL